MLPDVVTIDARFRGPTESGNGGYVCGRLGLLLDDPNPVVRLMAPPPLDWPLAVQETEKGMAFMDGGQKVGEARPGHALEITLPVPPSFEEAEAAIASFRGFHFHPFPECFVCGPKRDAGDGLRIFPGPIKGRDIVASHWVPHQSLQNQAGQIAPEFVWSALDCPGAFAFEPPEGKAVVLGEMQVQVKGLPAVDEPCVVIGWEIAHDGRKHRTGTALFGASRDCLGVGVGTWFEIPV